MSWETLVTGCFKIKDNVSKVEKEKIISELEDALECKIKYDERFREYVFQDVNWVSHVRHEEVEEVFNKYKSKLLTFYYDLYYLLESNEHIGYEDFSAS